MDTTPITVNLPTTTVTSIHTLTNHANPSTTDLITLSTHASTCTKLLISKIKTSTPSPTPSPSHPTPSPPSLPSSQPFLIYIQNSLTHKVFPLSVESTTLNREVAEMMEKHAGWALRGTVLRDRRGKMVYGWDRKTEGSPVKLRRLEQDGVKEGDLLSAWWEEGGGGDGDWLVLES